ncbi:MAG: hypothetical protein K6G58_05745 [Lachnospiraceae bacterium]|nr:hypothetical protein [Lachnospiraceae bacterium]
MIQGIDNFQVNQYSQYTKVQADLERNAELKKLGEQSAAATEGQHSQEASKELDLRLDDIRPRANASLEDISLSLTDNGSFEMKGRDSDINSLDIEKAVSDMQKDEALMQYQFFVGDTNIAANEDGIVIAK